MRCIYLPARRLVTVQYWVLGFRVLVDCYRSVLGAWIPGISGKFTFFRKVISRDVLPLRCLNGTPQSVNGFVRRLSIHALSHRSAVLNDWKPLILLSRACMCELNDSMRLLVWGQWSILKL